MQKNNIQEFNNNLSKNLLVTAPMHFLPTKVKKISKLFNVTYAFRASKNEIMGIIHKFDGWILDPGADYMVDKEIISMGENLEVIISPSTGSDHVDLNYCKEKGIYFDCLKGKENIIEDIHASAEFSFALLLSILKFLVPASKSALQGKWRECEDQFRGIELSGKVVGIIGLGRIGKKMARYCNAFGAKVIFYDPDQASVENTTKIDSLDRLLMESNIVCMHVHLNESTRNFFGEKEFDLMKKGSYFINTSRGGIVDEEAMIGALESGKILAAGVDVIKGEQSSDLSEHPLVIYANSNSNLLLTPHIAGLTSDSQGKAADFAIDCISHYFFQSNTSG